MTNLFLGTSHQRVKHKRRAEYKLCSHVKTISENKNIHKKPRSNPQTHIICKYDIYKGVLLSQRLQLSMHTLEKIYAGKM